jgi:hypothetical protein
MSDENYREISHLPENSSEMDITEVSEESANVVQGGRRRRFRKFLKKVGHFTINRAKKGFPLIRRGLGSPF